VTAGLYTALVAACLGVLFVTTHLVNGFAHPRGQHHGGRAERVVKASAREARAAWDGEPEPLLFWSDGTLDDPDSRWVEVSPLAIWSAPVSRPVPDPWEVQARAKIAADVKAGLVAAAAVPRPWAEETGSFAALTARDLATPGGPG
jgi:hypothetical protein